MSKRVGSYTQLSEGKLCSYIEFLNTEVQSSTADIFSPPGAKERKRLKQIERQLGGVDVSQAQAERLFEAALASPMLVGADVYGNAQSGIAELLAYVVSRAEESASLYIRLAKKMQERSKQDQAAWVESAALVGAAAGLGDEEEVEGEYDDEDEEDIYAPDTSAYCEALSCLSDHLGDLKLLPADIDEIARVHFEVCQAGLVMPVSDFIGEPDLQALVTLLPHTSNPASLSARFSLSATPVADISALHLSLAWILMPNMERDQAKDLLSHLEEFYDSLAAPLGAMDYNRQEDWQIRVLVFSIYGLLSNKFDIDQEKFGAKLADDFYLILGETSAHSLVCPINSFPGPKSLMRVAATFFLSPKMGLNYRIHKSLLEKFVQAAATSISGSDHEKEYLGFAIILTSQVASKGLYFGHAQVLQRVLDQHS
jgi:hypothetical protein